jgi:ferredoxin
MNTEQTSIEALTKEVKEMALDLGMHLVGITPVERMSEAPEELHPRRLLPETKTLISLGYRLNRGIRQVHLRGISPMAFSRFAGLEPRKRLEDAALDLANHLEDIGYIALPMPANQYLRKESGMPELSHRHVAMAAGLGRLGRGGFLVTRQYGGAVQLTTVLTDAPLIPDSMIEDDPCEGCAQPCVSICPMNAILTDRDRTVVMDGKEYRYGWLSYLRCMWGCAGLVINDRFYGLSDIPMPKLKEEDDGAKVRLEYLLAGEKRFPWDKSYRGSFTYNACSKCYAACKPRKQ